VLRYLTVNLLAPVSSCECCSIIDKRCMPLRTRGLRPRVGLRVDSPPTRVNGHTTGSPNMSTHNRPGLHPSRALRHSGASNAVQHQCPRGVNDELWMFIVDRSTTSDARRACPVACPVACPCGARACPGDKSVTVPGRTRLTEEALRARRSGTARRRCPRGSRSRE
jgi:hypothetical protein